jgi:hypothetical protein
MLVISDTHRPEEDRLHIFVFNAAFIDAVGLDVEGSEGDGIVPTYRHSFQSSCCHAWQFSPDHMILNSCQCDKSYTGMKLDLKTAIGTPFMN